MPDSIQKYGTLVTKIGNAAIANATVIGPKIDLREFAVGDGGGAYYVPDEDMSSLRHEVWRGQITNYEIDSESPNLIVVKTVIPSNVGGFTVREAGIYDVQGRFIAVCNYAEVQKVAISEGSPAELELVMYIAVENTDSFVWNVDPTVIVATKKELREHNRAPDAHENRFAPLEAYTELVRLEHALGSYPDITVLGILQWGAGMGGAGNGPAGGIDMDSLPVHVRYHSRNSLTIYTTRAAARPGVAKQLHGGGREWTVTFAGDELSSLYILLTGGMQSGQPPSGSATTPAVHTGNMVFGDTPPQDASLIWGDTSKGA